MTSYDHPVVLLEPSEGGGALTVLEVLADDVLDEAAHEHDGVGVRAVEHRHHRGDAPVLLRILLGEAPERTPPALAGDDDVVLTILIELPQRDRLNETVLPNAPNELAELSCRLVDSETRLVGIRRRST